MKTKCRVLLFFFFLCIFISCKKQDIDQDNSHIDNLVNADFLKHDKSLSPAVNLVFNNIKKNMSSKQINSFIKNAGLIKWNNAKAYEDPKLNTAARQEGSTDSIVVLPVALPEANNINAALVAKLYNNGDSIVYSIHYKNHFSSIENEVIPNSNLTAKELYILGMAQLDADVFNHNKFIIVNTDLTFGQSVSGRGLVAGITTINIIPSGCEYNFTYSSPTVFPPVVVYTYYTTCGSTILLPPSVFLQNLDETYGFVNFSTFPEGQGSGSTSSPYALNYSIFYNSLTSIQQSFLDNVEYYEFYQGFIDYMILHQFSQASQDHIVWCINYLLSPTTLIPSFSDFKDIYLNDFPSLQFLSQDDNNWLNNYPFFKSKIYYYLQNSFIINAEQKIQFHIEKMRTESS